MYRLLLVPLMMAVGSVGFTGAEAMKAIGADYYYESVWLGLILGVAIYCYRESKGYELKGINLFIVPSTVVFVILSVPTMISMTPDEDILAVPYLGLIITIAMTFICVNLGFTGSKEK